MDEMEKMLKDLENNINFEVLDNLWNDNLEELDKDWALETLEELNNFRY